MTPATRNVYDALLRFYERETWGPTLRELAAEAGLSSVSSVLPHLAKLEAEGFVERKPGREAGIRCSCAPTRRPRMGAWSPTTSTRRIAWR
jgi:DNA-binding MarR family transcriptional regulator